MKDNDLLTIKEFAEAAGVSSQAVYQRLTKSLQPYVVKVNGKKHLKREALELFEGAEPKAENKEVEQDSINLDKELIKTLQATISILQGQLETKDEQIAELNARLKDALDLSKGQVLLSVTERQQLPEVTETAQEDAAKQKRTFWDRVKRWWE